VLVEQYATELELGRDLGNPAWRAPENRDADYNERHPDQIVDVDSVPLGRPRITSSHRSGLNPTTTVPTTIADAPIILPNTRAA
jgi:hypothetical protein